MAALGGSVARRYARALFDLGVSKGTFEAYGQTLGALSGVYESSPELRQTLEHPMFTLEQRRRVLEKVLAQLAPDREIQTFAMLLLERRRMPVLPAIARSYRDMVDAKLGRVRATVTSARPLDPNLQTLVERGLERRTGKKIVMTTEVNPALIGGIVARVGDLVFDGSLRTRLESLRSRILD